MYLKKVLIEHREVGFLKDHIFISQTIALCGTASCYVRDQSPTPFFLGVRLDLTCNIGKYGKALQQWMGLI